MFGRKKFKNWRNDVCPVCRERPCRSHCVTFYDCIQCGQSVMDVYWKRTAGHCHSCYEGPPPGPRTLASTEMKKPTAKTLSDLDRILNADQ